MVCPVGYSSNIRSVDHILGHFSWGLSKSPRYERLDKVAVTLVRRFCFRSYPGTEYPRLVGGAAADCEYSTGLLRPMLAHAPTSSELWGIFKLT